MPLIRKSDMNKLLTANSIFFGKLESEDLILNLGEGTLTGKTPKGNKLVKRLGNIMGGRKTKVSERISK